MAGLLAFIERRREASCHSRGCGDDGDCSGDAACGPEPFTGVTRLACGGGGGGVY